MAKTKHKKKLEKKAAKEVTKEVASNFCKDCKNRVNEWCGTENNYVPRKHTCEQFRSK